MNTSRTDASRTDHATPARHVPPLLRTLGDADAAVCVDGLCEVPANTAETTNVTQGADE